MALFSVSPMRSGLVRPSGRPGGLVQGVVVVLLVAAWHAGAVPPPEGTPAALTGLVGGLVVQVGAGDVRSAATMGQTGRYVVQVLDANPGTVLAARQVFRKAGCYGLATAVELRGARHLPYAPDLVNLVVVRAPGVSAAELFRVLAPGGTAVVSAAGLVDPADLAAAGFRVTVAPGGEQVARKPWPKAMDEWSHPRHGADGNPVSRDTAVGPPDRVRWIAGAVDEVEGMVSAGGRNFYGGLLARDSFNGLRLWDRNLSQGTLDSPGFRLPRIRGNRARPIASDRLVFAVERDRLVALNAADGELVRSFPDMTGPTEAVHVGGTIVACNDAGVHAVGVADGKGLWSYSAAGSGRLVGDERYVCITEGRPKLGEQVRLTVLEAPTGKILWQRSDYPWLARVARLVLHGDLLVCEASTLSDHDTGCGLHVVDPATGKLVWEKDFPPGMNHNRQARAMFGDDRLWILHGGKVDTDDPKRPKHLPIQVWGLDPASGEKQLAYPAGLVHCFPPIATSRYLLAGVMDFTDLQTGKLTVNPITKANCSREGGWLLANGLIYTTPKHCTCWPILRGFTALAPAGPSDEKVHAPVDQIDFALVRSPAAPPANSPPPSPADWPLYRHDRWRSGSTTSPGPAALTTLWSVPLAGADTAAAGPIVQDWRENAFVKGPVTPPTVADGMVYVARPDAQEVVALAADTGAVRWRFTADGRVDTPPTIHRGLCLFGSHAGTVSALRAADGQLVWRMRAGPLDEGIVAYGQIESPWPVPGTVLIRDDIAYFAAGRQPLGDGGLFVFAVDPRTGRRHWVRRIDTVPQKGFYENSGLEFDSFDILHQEGEGIALSRWLVSLDGKTVNVDKWNAFARLNTGGGTVYVPRDFWTYGPRHQQRFGGESPVRPLCAFRGHVLVSYLNGTTTLFRRDFDLESGETFNTRWITGWKAAEEARQGGSPFRSHRLAEKAKWQVDPFSAQPPKPGPRKRGARLHNNLFGMVLAGNDRLFVVHEDGRAKCIDIADGTVVGSAQLPPPVWDGLALAQGRLYLTTRGGELVCLGGPGPDPN